MIRSHLQLAASFWSVSPYWTPYPCRNALNSSALSPPSSRQRVISAGQLSQSPNWRRYGTCWRVAGSGDPPFPFRSWRPCPGGCPFPFAARPPSSCSRPCPWPSAPRPGPAPGASPSPSWRTRPRGPSSPAPSSAWRYQIHPRIWGWRTDWRCSRYYCSAIWPNGCPAGSRGATVRTTRRASRTGDGLAPPGPGGAGLRRGSWWGSRGRVGWGWGWAGGWSMGEDGSAWAKMGNSYSFNNRNCFWAATPNYKQ